jgi:hypothetical protein
LVSHRPLIVSDGDGGPSNGTDRLSSEILFAPLAVAPIPTVAYTVGYNYVKVRAGRRVGVIVTGTARVQVLLLWQCVSGRFEESDSHDATGRVVLGK